MTSRADRETAIEQQRIERLIEHRGSKLAAKYLAAELVRLNEALRSFCESETAASRVPLVNLRLFRGGRCPQKEG